MLGLKTIPWSNKHFISSFKEQNVVENLLQLIRFIWSSPIYNHRPFSIFVFIVSIFQPL